MAAYLGKAFEGYTISREAVSHSAAARFALRRVDSELLLDVGGDFLDAHDAPGLGATLEALDLRGELTRADGMPMILTAEGLRLVSGN